MGPEEQVAITAGWVDSYDNGGVPLPDRRQTVLITGGAGSLGRAFCRLLSKRYKLIVVDNNEWAISELQTELPEVTCALGDFSEYPLSGTEDFIIHAAAYKHVNLGESNAQATIQTNLVKTIQFYDRVRYSLAKLLYISTDKAVEPVSVYGATKFLAERLTQEVGGSVARLGNILSSSGSVIPVWERAIQAGAAIPITDERMTRYLIEDYDAVNQIWNEFLGGKTLIVPKMPPPVRLLDLLGEVLKRHGFETVESYTPGVEVIGMRPGEKLTEKLYWDNEVT